MDSSGGKVEGLQYMIFCKDIANLARLWYQMHRKTLSLFFTAKSFFISAMYSVKKRCLKSAGDILLLLPFVPKKKIE